MSRLREQMEARQAEPRVYTEAEQVIRARYEARKTSLVNLAKNKDFKAYLELEREMNNPAAVIAHKCSDPVCEALKAKIRDFHKRERLLATLTNGAAR